MRTPSRAGLPVAAIIAMVAAGTLTAACGDSQDGASGATTPTATDTASPAPTPTATAIPFQHLLEQMVLQTEDLPAGLSRATAVTTTNEELASRDQDPEDELARIEASGRLLGYSVDFVTQALPERGIIAVGSEARLFITPDGAMTAFLEDVQELRSANWAAAYPDLADLQAREVERPGLADQVIWTRIGGLEDADEGTLRLEHFVVLRRDRVWAFVRVQSRAEASAGRDAFLQDVEDLVTLQVQRIDAALQESEP